MESWIMLYFVQFIDNPNSKTGNNSNSNNNNYGDHYDIVVYLHKDYNNSKHITLGIIDIKHQMEGISMTYWRDGNNNNSKIDNDTRINHDFYVTGHEDELDDGGGNITGKTDDSPDFLVNTGLYDLDNDLMYDLDSDMGNIKANNNNGKRRSESQDMIADSISKLQLCTNNNTLGVDNVANTRGMHSSNDNSETLVSGNNDNNDDNDNDDIDAGVRELMMTNATSINTDSNNTIFARYK